MIVQGLCLYKEGWRRIIYECALNYEKLLDIEYEFHVSEKRKIKKMILRFSEREFFHLAGFQHLTDLSLPRNRNITVKAVLSGKITDQILSKSKYYVNDIKDEKNIRDRICELQYLEEYIDTNNIIKIFSLKETPFLYSDIDADYIIESSILTRNKTVYIFLKEKKEEPGVYCVVSFFVKQTIPNIINAKIIMPKIICISLFSILNAFQ